MHLIYLFIFCKINELQSIPLPNIQKKKKKAWRIVTPPSLNQILGLGLKVKKFQLKGLIVKSPGDATNGDYSTGWQKWASSMKWNSQINNLGPAFASTATNIKRPSSTTRLYKGAKHVNNLKQLYPTRRNIRLHCQSPNHKILETYNKNI